MFEKDFIDWIAARKKRTPSTLIGVGDDACLLTAQKHSTVVTTDTLSDQVHFDSRQHSLTRIGRKSMAVNISDILAMGAKPEQALLTFVLPREFTLEQAKELYIGAEEVASANEVDIVGGDTNRHDGPLVVGAAMIGYVAPQHVWRIDQARVGDDLLVTGELGGSILGKHLDFQPRTQWVQRVAGSYPVHAATDITDSLSLDLAYLARKSGVGIQLNGSDIPISAEAHQVAQKSGRSPLDHALTDGEDFELILSVSPTVSQQLTQLFPDVVTPIGKVVSPPDLKIQIDGQWMNLDPKGYVH